jgi:hypothetical protein
MRRAVIAAAAVLAGAPSTASAFCGFYVAGSDQPLVADATQVVLMRKGTRTVLSMQNNYKGPPEAFAVVIPVPVVLKEQDVKVLPAAVFANVERMGAPRLVEYWEQDPCRPIPEFAPMAASAGAGPPRPAAKAARRDDLGVTVEAQFTLGEYQIVILSARESTGLDTWLRREKYNIPRGAEPLLRPYVESGMKFFVAKVDPKKVRFVAGRADLSPLRFHYDTEQFVLPIRLGLANSGGTQDLIVSILAPGQRYEVANGKNVTIPTNLDVKEAVRDRFGAFYAALFDRTLERHPGAVVTEYAWQAATCDPCPGPTLNGNDFMTLGADVLDPREAQIAAPPSAPSGAGPGAGPGVRPAPPMRRRWTGGNDFVLTRLHARYGKDLKDDLVFRAAPPIVGGREFVRDGGKLEEGAQPSSVNNFQGRYAIRHRWTGPVACAQPRRGVWGGPPDGGARPPQAALNLAFAPRTSLALPTSIEGDVPEIGLRKGVLEPVPRK